MKKVLIRIFDFFNTLESKIAFYPSLMAISGFLLALLMMYLEEKGISRSVMDIFPRLMVEDGDTALTVLSACVGGMISLMVFSFSMVMLLLSQASNNYSPRLLPGLISDKRHQVILGLYLATILYMIFIIFSIEPSDKRYALPGVSILLGILFTIMSLVAFIYFIHNISQSIQINNILDNIFVDAKKRLSVLIASEANTLKSFPDTSEWYEYKIGKSGYIQNIAIGNLLDICKQENTRMYFTIPKGIFALSNQVFLKSEKALEPNIVKAVQSNINFSRGELVSDNYVLAFKQITEIAVKAMSPGINDPGTAINAIDYITELFAIRMLKRDDGIIMKDNEVKFRLAIISFRELMYNVMASLRTYCKHDPIIAQKILWMLDYLQQQPSVEEEYKEVVRLEINTWLDQVQESIESKRDLEVLAKYSKYQL